MGQLAIPMMIGAAVGGGTKLLQGKGIGGILKGAALGGALGGATGGIGGLMGQGAAGAASTQGANGLLGIGAENLAPTLIESATPLATSAVSNVVPNSIDSVMQFNQATGSYLSPESYLAASSANPIYTGTGSMLDKFKMGAQSLGSDFSSMMPNNIGVDNLLGAGQIAMGQPTRAAPIASQPIQVGQAPSPEGMAQFINQYYPQYKKQRPDLGLTG